MNQDQTTQSEINPEDSNKGPILPETPQTRIQRPAQLKSIIIQGPLRLTEKGFFAANIRTEYYDTEEQDEPVRQIAQPPRQDLPQIRDETNQRENDIQVNNITTNEENPPDTHQTEEGIPVVAKQTVSPQLEIRPPVELKNHVIQDPLYSAKTGAFAADTRTEYYTTQEQGEPGIPQAQTPEQTTQQEEPQQQEAPQQEEPQQDTAPNIQKDPTSRMDKTEETAIKKTPAAQDETDKQKTIAPETHTQASPQQENQQQTGPRVGVMRRGRYGFFAVETKDAAGRTQYYRIERRGRRFVYRRLNSRVLEQRARGGGGFTFEPLRQTTQQPRQALPQVASKTNQQERGVQANIRTTNDGNAVGTRQTEEDLHDETGSMAPSMSGRQNEYMQASSTGVLQVKIAPGSKFRIDLENNTIEAV